jgi:hypothetical protein
MLRNGSQCCYAPLIVATARRVSKNRGIKKTRRTRVRWRQGFTRRVPVCNSCINSSWCRLFTMSWHCAQYVTACNDSFENMRTKVSILTLLFALELKQLPLNEHAIRVYSYSSLSSPMTSLLLPSLTAPGGG